LEYGASAHDLPNSNQGQEDGISQAETGATVEFDPRAIPASAKESLWRAADGHEIRTIAWGSVPDGVGHKGHMLFMAGRGDAYEKYLEAFEYWRLRGWNVTAADWRGQGGSGRLGHDDRTGHIDDFLTWVKDLGEFWQAWAKGRSGPLVLVGHSMGGHLTLRAVMERALEPAPDALVLSAPMLDVFPEHAPLFAKRALAALMVRLGGPTRPAWKMSEKPGSKASARVNLLTHDERRYEDERWWRAHRPELKLGPGSWGWVAEAMDSVSALFRPGGLESVDVPVFMLATDADKLVSPVAIRRAIDRLPDVESLVFGKEARHEILREVDPVRAKALSSIDEFLDRRVAR